LVPPWVLELSPRALFQNPEGDLQHSPDTISAFRGERRGGKDRPMGGNRKEGKRRKWSMTERETGDPTNYRNK